MSNFRILLTAVAAIVPFLCGVQVFSHDIQTVGGATFAEWFGTLTRSRWRALVLGAVATALVNQEFGERTFDPFFLLQLSCLGSH
jgi:phosphate:Na+ symporter